MTAEAGALRGRPLAAHFWLGLGLVAAAWPLSWSLPGLRTHYLFFPLWLGYILAVDALVLRRRGSSLLRRAPGGFALLFAASVPGWWLFEALNQRVRNWIYLGGDQFSTVEYYFFASLSFSTVVPAVFETAELVRGAAWIERLERGPRPPLAGRPLLCFLLGAAMLALLLTWPRVLYPLLWLALVFLLDPLCVWLGKRSLSATLARGDWRPAVALALGALACGLFWELWNWRSYPKWIYETPGVEFAHLFEMPLLGYFGYLPFGLELYAFTHLLLPRPPDLRL